MGDTLWRFIDGHDGQDLVEYALLTAAFAVACVILIPMLVRWPVIADNAVLLAVVGSLIGGVAWSAKQSLSALTNRTQLGILEVLSSSGPLSRTELQERLRQIDWPLRWLPEMYTDALTALVTAGKVTIVEGGRYAVPHSSPLPINGAAGLNS
jgi:Flp pilus assembly pilin Flp